METTVQERIQRVSNLTVKYSHNEVKAVVQDEINLQPVFYVDVLVENSFENRSLLSAQRQEPPGQVEPKSILKNVAAIFMTVGHNSRDPDVIRIYWDESVWCLLPIYSQFEQPR